MGAIDARARLEQAIDRWLSGEGSAETAGNSLARAARAYLDATADLVPPSAPQERQDEPVPS